MLLGEQRRRHEQRNLLAAVHSGEGSTQRNLGLAEANVTADNSIHRAVRAQVGEHLVDRSILVVGEFEREATLEGAIIRLGPAEAMPGARCPARIDVEQFRGYVTDLPDRALPGFSPLVAAEAMQRSVLRRCAGVA